MKKLNLSELVEEMVDDRIHAWLLDDGTYYLACVEENGDEFELAKNLKEVSDVYDILTKYGLC